MKANINADGILMLISESEMEKFALNAWIRKHRLQKAKYISLDLTKADHEKTFHEFAALMSKEAEAFDKFRKAGLSLIEFSDDGENIEVRERQNKVEAK